MKKKLGFVVFLVIIFIAGMVANHYWRLTTLFPTSIKTQKASNVLYWVAPMDPNYRRDKPGKSPMGMDLVPVYADKNADENKSIIKISPTVENNLGVRTAKVKRIDLSRVIDTFGYVTANENDISQIHTYTSGWVKILNVKTTGELVKKGQLLFQLYSPVLNNAQAELLLALKNNNSILIRAGKKKLLTLGMAQQQINQVVKKRHVMQLTKVYAPQSGIVSMLNIREGNHVKPENKLMIIEDLSHLWVIAEVFERQTGWVKVGQQATATFPYLPGKIWQGKVEYVYPELNAKTHTLRVRLTFPNPDLTIKPQMYANIKILSHTIKNTLTIPREALIRTGDGDRVIVALGGGRFKAQAVNVGIESGNYYQILSGLTSKDVVVTSAQFLIDSESNLRAGLSRIQDIKESVQKTSNSASPSKEFIGMGKVKRVDIKKRIIVLDHQPIPALKMPAMSMELNVDKDVDLTKVKPGVNIHFVIIKHSDQSYLVTKIHVVE